MVLKHKIRLSREMLDRAAPVFSPFPLIYGEPVLLQRAQQASETAVHVCTYPLRLRRPLPDRFAIWDAVSRAVCVR